MSLPPTITNPALAAYAQAASRATDGPRDDQTGASQSFGNLLANTIDNAIDANRKSENTAIQAASGQSSLRQCCGNQSSNGGFHSRSCDLRISGNPADADLMLAHHSEQSDQLDFRTLIPDRIMNLAASKAACLQLSA